MNENVFILFVQFGQGVMRGKIFQNWLHWVKFYCCSRALRGGMPSHIGRGWPAEKLHLGGEWREWRVVSQVQVLNKYSGIESEPGERRGVTSFLVSVSGVLSRDLDCDR